MSIKGNLAFNIRFPDTTRVEVGLYSSKVNSWAQEVLIVNSAKMNKIECLKYMEFVFIEF